MQFNKYTHTHTHTATTAARSGAHHAKDQSPGTGGEGQDRGGRKRVKEAQEPQKSYRRDVENGGDLSERRKKRRKEIIGSVDVNPEDLNNIKGP